MEPLKSPKKLCSIYIRGTLFVACIATLFVYSTKFQLLQIKSGSMEPTFPTFCKILVYRTTSSNYQRWEPIIFRHPLRSEEIQLKRIVGLPGERIRVFDGNLYRQEGSEWKILTKPATLQEGKSFWQGEPLFEEVFYYQKQKNQWSSKKNPWEGWSIDQWKSVPQGYQGKGLLTYSLPPWSIFERPGGIRSDQRERILVLERPHAEVRFRLHFQTKGNFQGLIQEAEHQIIFQVQAQKATLSVHYLWNSPVSPPTPISILLAPSESYQIEFGHYDDFAYLQINGKRLSLHYLSDPFQEASAMQFQFNFLEECLLSEVHVDMDNAYKKEIEGTIETSLSKNPPEYFVCGDNTLVARLEKPQNEHIEIGLSNDSRTWEKIRVTHSDGKIEEYEDQMEDLPLYQKGQIRSGKQVEYGLSSPGLPATAIQGKVIAVLPEEFSHFWSWVLICFFYFLVDLFSISLFQIRFQKQRKNEDI